MTLNTFLQGGCRPDVARSLDENHRAFDEHTGAVRDDDGRLLGWIRPLSWDRSEWEYVRNGGRDWCWGGSEADCRRLLAARRTS